MGGLLGPGDRSRASHMRKRRIWKPRHMKPGVLNIRCVGFGFGPGHPAEAPGLLLFFCFLPG